MDKSILIIDTPKNCDECRICAIAENKDYCAYLGFSKGEFIYPNGYAELAIGMSNCPLRPLPERFESTILTDYCLGNADGWNACIEDILGEEDGK